MEAVDVLSGYRGVLRQPYGKSHAPNLVECVAKGAATFISLTAVECVRWNTQYKVKNKNSDL